MEFKYLGDAENPNAVTIYGYTFIKGEFVKVNDTTAIEALQADGRFESRNTVRDWK